MHQHQPAKYPAQADSITGPLLADGYTITWAPHPAGCSLTLDRHGPQRGWHDAYRGWGRTVQDAWDEVREQLGEPPAAGITREEPEPPARQRPPLPRGAVLRLLALRA